MSTLPYDQDSKASQNCHPETSTYVSLAKTGHGESREMCIFNWAHCPCINIKCFISLNEGQINNG